MIPCPHCQAPNRPAAKFCGVCGKPLSLPKIRSDALHPVESAEVTADGASADFQRALQNEIAPPADVPITMPEPASRVVPTLSSEPLQSNTDADAVPNSQTDKVMEPAPPFQMGNESPTLTDSAHGLEQIVDSVEPAPTLTALPLGTVLQDRFTLVELMRQAPDENIYRARDEWRCPSCNFENEADAVFCSNCGRELTEHGTLLLIERLTPTDGTALSDGMFIANGRMYEIQLETLPVAALDNSSMQQIHYAIASDVGVVRGSAREPNEDSAFALTFSAMHESQPHPAFGLFIIADGIGGSEAGELASKTAIQVLSTSLLQAVAFPLLAGQTHEDAIVREHLRTAILNANEQVRELAAEKKNDMGTTLTLALTIDRNAYIANVGDSRTYLLRNGTLQPVTRDHSLVMELVESNMISREEIYTHPQRNIILRSLGANAELEVDVFPQEGGALHLQKGDRLLLCTDGLWEMVRDFDLESQLLRENDLQKAAANLIAAANEQGGQDNVTLILLNID